MREDHRIAIGLRARKCGREKGDGKREKAKEGGMHTLTKRSVWAKVEEASHPKSASVPLEHMSANPFCSAPVQTPPRKHSAGRRGLERWSSVREGTRWINIARRPQGSRPCRLTGVDTRSCGGKPRVWQHRKRESGAAVPTIAAAAANANAACRAAATAKATAKAAANGATHAAAVCMRAAACMRAAVRMLLLRARVRMLLLVVAVEEKGDVHRLRRERRDPPGSERGRRAWEVA